MYYKTLKEKSAEWNISLRHLQYLCKQGRIDGAVKKAGTWFVPDGAPMPAQYTKDGGGRIRFVGTRKKIFDCAVALFKSKGFEAVGMKDIAEAVGITQSSMYNHFKSKSEILDTIYDVFRLCCLEERPRPEALDPILRGGSLEDIIRSAAYGFDEHYNRQMTDIVTILLHRCAIDDRARELTKSLMIDEKTRYVESVFDRAVQIGRLAPLDTRAIAVLINSIGVFMLHNHLANPSDESRLLLEKDEQKLYQYASSMLTDLNPPDAASG